MSENEVEPGERPVFERMAERESEEIRSAFTRVIDYLTTEYIVEECIGEPTVGCFSCEAIALRKQLMAFRREVSHPGSLATLPPAKRS